MVGRPRPDSGMRVREAWLVGDGLIGNRPELRLACSGIRGWESDVTDYRVIALDAETWGAFEQLMERHNGVFRGCWCTWFHTMADEKTRDAEDNRALKERLVKQGRSHAAVVFDGEEAVDWCQFGSPQEFPDIRHGQQYGAAGWTSSRTTGGLVEGYPHDNRGARQAVLYSGTRALFEKAGFANVRDKGDGNRVMRRDVHGKRAAGVAHAQHRRHPA